MGLLSEFEKHFRPEEFLQPEFFELFYTKKQMYELLDPRVRRSVMRLRNIAGPLIMNTWHLDRLIGVHGNHQYRGLRSKNCTVGAARSLHKYGLAADVVPIKCTSRELRQSIVDNTELHPEITFLETFTGMSWVHVGCNERDQFRQVAVWKPANKTLDLDIGGRDVFLTGD